MEIIKPSIDILNPKTKEQGIQILKDIEIAGRTCYKSEDKISNDSYERFILMLTARGHGAMIEHGSMQVRIICDRGVTHEIVRHRIASFAQESTRYCNYGKQGEIRVIDLATGFNYDLNNHLDKMKYEVWKKAMKQAEFAYMKMLDFGASPQEARSVLPNSLKTEIIVTANLREWRHFFHLRNDKAAHPQMREVANMILTEAQKRIPIVFDNIKYASEK